MFSRLRDQRGFTVIEIIVMASVATVGILATMLVANATQQTSDTNERKVAGTNLAREGIELVRAARDSNWQAFDRQQQAGTPPGQRQQWDCYVTTAAQATATPPGCDEQFRTNANAVNYAAHPNAGNGVPYFTAITSGDPSNTSQAAYLVCQNGSGTLYVPTAPSANGTCPSGQSFFRRVSVQRGKNLGGGQYNLLVKAYVTWPEQDGQPVLIEEYLSDWRKFP